MKKWYLVAALIAFLFSIFSLSWADPIIRSIYYQKKTTLTYPKKYTFLFSLWTDKTSTDPLDMVWSEEQTIRMTSGTIKTYLGSQTSPLNPADFGQQLWVRVQRYRPSTDDYVDVGARDLFGVVPYAMWSETTGGVGEIVASDTVSELDGSSVAGSSTQYSRGDHQHGIGTGSITSTHILDGTIENSDIATNAAISGTKLASDGSVVKSLVAGTNIASVVNNNNGSWTINGASVEGDITEVIAGTGLTGGGTSGSVTVNVGAGTGITVAADSVSADTTYLQRRVTGNCPAGQSIRVVNTDGTVTCESAGAGDITGVTAGTGLSGGGLTGDVSLSADTTYLQRRVGGTCTSGTAIQVINADGSVSCQAMGTGDVTAVTAGSGLTGGGISGDLTLNVGQGAGILVAADTVAVDTTAIQARVTGTCPAGQAMRVISSAGTVTCEPVVGGTGDITAVYAGWGLTGGATSGDVTLNVDFAGSGAAQTVSRSDHGHFLGYWTGNSSSPGLEVYNTGSGNGIRGYTYSTSMDNAGVHGTNTSTGSGVYGESSGGPGVRGISSTGDGVRGESSGSNKTGVYGVSNQADGFGVYGRNTGGGYGVYSNGNLHVQGDLEVTGASPFPRPTYDSGWVDLSADSSVFLNPQLPPPAYSNNNFFIHLRIRDSGVESGPVSGAYYWILTDNTIGVHNLLAHTVQIKLWVWYVQP